jgi:ribosomal protein S18 acetylase RimI-like enzyme
MLEPLLSPSPEVVRFLEQNRPGFELAEGAPIEPSEAYLQGQLDVRGQELFTARLGGEIAALAMTMPHPRDGIPWIGFLLVDDRHRGRGLGRRVVDELCQIWKARGARELQIGVVTHNHAGQRFWKTIGFVPFDERSSQPHGVMCSVMRKELAQ